MVVVVSLLAGPTAVADCRAAGLLSGGATELASTVDGDDIDRISFHLGKKPSHVVCGRTPWGNTPPFPAGRGFFALTDDDAVFVTDRRRMETLFQVAFADIHRIESNVIGRRGQFDTLRLYITTVEGIFLFELPLAGGAADMVSELRKRAGV